MTGERPLGVFDSGLGGLSVVREIRRRLPHEDVIYIADSAYCPYGGRPLEEIRERAVAVSQNLLVRGAKIIVVACNTASGAAIEFLRESFSVPIVGLEPAVKPAASSSVVRRIAVLATPATLQTQRFHRLLDRFAGDVEVVRVACPGFVELVESGEISGPNATEIVRDVLAPAIEAQVDRVVLGCTHYPFLHEVIADVLGPGVEILDSGAAVARQVERVLTEESILRDRGPGSLSLYTTGDPSAVQPVIDRIWGEAATVRSA